MNNLFIKKNLSIFIAYLLLIIITGSLLFNTDKSDFHYTINSLVGNPIFDALYKNITYLGDGFFAINLSLAIILIYNIRTGIMILLSYASSGIFITVLKRVFFDDINRPTFVFKYLRHQQLNYVEGAETLIHHSFPSGHSGAAFALFFSLIFMTDKLALKWVYFIIAILTAFSRTYLSQHWLIDIYVGSIIGTFFAILVYTILYKKTFMEKLNKSLLSMFL